jgi:hypothetical protein
MNRKNILLVTMIGAIMLVGTSFGMDESEKGYKDRVNYYTAQIEKILRKQDIIYGEPSKKALLYVTKVFDQIRYAKKDIEALIEAYDNAIDNVYLRPNYKNDPAFAEGVGKSKKNDAQMRAQWHIKGNPELEQYVYDHAQ